MLPPSPPPCVQLPSKLKGPTPEELEALKLNRSLGRALENNTALAEAVSSKDDLIKDLNSRIKQVQFFFGHLNKLPLRLRALAGPDPDPTLCSRRLLFGWTRNWLPRHVFRACLVPRDFVFLA